ncbi:MAG: hypothetical protein AAFP76_01560 [Bacteroidota bacterium]
MTKSIKLNAAVILLLLLSPVVLAQQHGQHSNCSDYHTARTIELDDSSNNESIKMEVDKDTKNLMISVNSLISSGSLTMEILDPKGDKQGNFSVESQLSSSTSSGGKNKEEVCGQLNKSFSEPMAGSWTIKLKPRKVTGKIQVSSHQIQ